MLKKSFSKSKPVCKVTFSLPLEAVKEGSDVRILGDFNNWSWESGYRMKPAQAEFSTEVELTAGKEYQFRYLIDNHIWENDWNADNYVATAFGEYNSVVSLLAEAVNGKAKSTALKAEVPAVKATPVVPAIVAEKATPAKTVSAVKAAPAAKKAAPAKPAAPKAAPAKPGKK